MPPTISGYKYVQSFIDDRTRLKYIYLLMKKSDAGCALRDFIVKFEREHDCLVKLCMLTTRQSLLVVISIAASASRASSLPALRRIHRNPTDSQKTSIRFCLLAFVAFHSGIDKVMWEEAAHHAVYLLNITPSRSLGNITPHEDGYGVVPDVSKLRVFGCVAFATLPHPKKLDDKAVRATNLGHIGYRKYRLLLPGPEYKIFVATSVKFDEQVFDFAADAVKEVTGIRNITGGDDIISDDMRLLADDDDDEDEYAEGSKAAPPVDSQNSDNHAGDVKNQVVEEVVKIDPTRMESFRSRNSYSRLADYLFGFSVYQQGQVARGY
jgi:hypothetical protein